MQSSVTSAQAAQGRVMRGVKKILSRDLELELLLRAKLSHKSAGEKSARAGSSG